MNISFKPMCTNELNTLKKLKAVEKRAYAEVTLPTGDGTTVKRELYDWLTDDGIVVATEVVDIWHYNTREHTGDIDIQISIRYVELLQKNRPRVFTTHSVVDDDEDDEVTFARERPKNPKKLDVRYYF